MSDEIIVSICCTTHNHDKYIKDAIEGFLNQKTTFPIEIIIHDDASKDNTANIIREYAAKNLSLIKPVYQTENQYSKGVKVSLVHVWPKAKGKYIALCEGDDYWIDPHKLQKQVDYLEANPDCGMVHTGVIIRKDGVFDPPSQGQLKPKSGKIYEDLLFENTICTASTVFRSMFLKEIQFDKSKAGFKSTDKMLWLYIALHSKIGFIDEITTVYRIVENSMTHQKEHKKRVEFIESSHNLIYYYIDNYGCSTEMQKNIYKKHIKTGFEYRNPQIIHNAYMRLSSVDKLTGKDKLRILIAKNQQVLYLYIYVLRILEICAKAKTINV